MQPINENNKLKALHTLYVGTTGAGKSQAVKRFGQIIATDQVVYWDPHKDHETMRGRVVRRYTSFVAFAKALQAGRKTRQGFKIALTVPEEREHFLKFCQIVWGFGDGLHPKRLHIVCEENPEVTKGIGRDKSIFGKIMNVGRKYGLVVHVVGGKTTEMSKTVISKTPFKWVGRQDAKADARRLSDDIDVSVDDIMTLQPLEFYFKNPYEHGAKRGKLIIRK